MARPPKGALLFPTQRRGSTLPSFGISRRGTEKPFNAEYLTPAQHGTQEGGKWKVVAAAALRDNN